MQIESHRAASCCSLLAALAIFWVGFQVGAGTINFANHASSSIVNGQTGYPVTAADGIRVALYWAPIGSSDFAQIAVTNVGYPVAGVFAGGVQLAGASIHGGGRVQFQLWAWGGSFSSFEEASLVPGVLTGKSDVFEAVTGSPEGDPPVPAGSLVAGGFRGFTLTANSTLPLMLGCASHKVVACGSHWTFDPPTVEDGCSVGLIISVLDTVTNGPCQVVTRTWLASDTCGGTDSCSQTVTMICADCLALSAKITDSELELSWASYLGLAYQVQYRTNLGSGNWVNLGPPVQGNGTTNRVHDVLGRAQPAAFYRLVSLGN